MKKLIFGSLIALIFFNSCESTEDENLLISEFDEHFVSIDEASSFATILEYQYKDHNSGRVSSEFKDIDKIYEIPDEDGKALYYIINYKDDGFISISADKRTFPIRAFSANQKFPIPDGLSPEGIVDWLATTAKGISDIRELNEQDYGTLPTWNPCQMQQVLTPTIIDDDGCGGSGGGGGTGGGGCQDQHWSYGPLLTTEWGQGSGFNDLAPMLGCGRAVTGCVATAIAQVMNYYEFPQDEYDWNLMPDGRNGSLETSQLMRDIGDAVGMDWGCPLKGSGASTEDSPSVFINRYGYSNASFGDFNNQTVKQQIRWNRPVILAAHQEANCFLGWCSYKRGHAWVCDGYNSWSSCETGNTYTYYHMNWGWRGTDNGYFAYNNWNPDATGSFNENKRMVYNIRP